MEQVIKNRIWMRIYINLTQMRKATFRRGSEQQENEFPTEEKVQWNPYLYSTLTSTTLSPFAVSHPQTSEKLTLVDSHNDSAGRENENFTSDNVASNETECVDCDETYSIDFLLQPGLKTEITKGSISSRKRLPVTKPMRKSCVVKSDVWRG